MGGRGSIPPAKCQAKQGITWPPPGPPCPHSGSASLLEAIVMSHSDLMAPHCSASSSRLFRPSVLHHGAAHLLWPICGDLEL